MNAPWSELVPKKMFQNGEWHLLPSFRSFLNWTQDYDVWFATVRDIYDRSALVQQVKVEENQTHIRIVNPTSTMIEGFTLYTKSLPEFDLVDGSTIYSSGKGTGNSWHFVIDLAPNSEVVLEKSYRMETSMSLTEIGMYMGHSNGELSATWIR
jgi:hypothetical protein